MPNERRMPTLVYMHTLGCPKNRVDSELMLGGLVDAGFRLVQDARQAEIIIVNTCAFIDAAKEESIATILGLAKMKQEGRCRKLVVAGCLAQRYHANLTEDLPEVDHFVGTSACHLVARIVAEAQAQRVVVPDPDFVHTAAHPRINSLPPYTAYLKISEGCDHTCAFCVIPKLRGPQRSRPIDDILTEGANLASQGVLELSLVAQDLTSYGGDLPGRPRLEHLLADLCKVAGIRWIRLHYAYPRNLSNPLIETIAREKKIVKYLDIPLQHSSDRLLRSMKRGSGSRTVTDLLARLREQVEDIALRTSLIVGLPGETEEDFEGLLSFVETQRFERLGVFEYSREEGTAAAEMPCQVPEKTKRARFEILMERQRSIASEQQAALVGRRLEVLVEGASDETEHLLVGRHAQQALDIDGVTYINAIALPKEQITEAPLSPGEIVTVEVTAAGDYDLVGTVVARG